MIHDVTEDRARWQRTPRANTCFQFRVSRAASSEQGVLGYEFGMPPLARAVGFLCGVLALTAMVWVGRYSPLATLLRTEEEHAWAVQQAQLQEIADDLKARELRRQKIEQEEREPPQVADKPPFPKVEIDATEFDFGEISLGKTVTHRFTIKNVGEGPLILRKLVSGAHCGNAPIGKRQTIQPGGVVNVDMAWTAMGPRTQFVRTSPIWTNDPAHPQFILKIHGRTAARGDERRPIERGPIKATRADAANPENQPLQPQAEIDRREWHRPPIADKPPFPKMVVDRDACDLGIFDAEQTVRNTFKITNVGLARLILVWHPVGCWHRPFPTFPHYQEVEPGKSLDIEITSTPHGEIRNFKKVLSFWTNDPTRPDLDLSISGSVVEAKR
jgi:hypothetical protein